MAEKDYTQKRLEEHPDVFADIFNTLVFGGKQILCPGRLRPRLP